MYRTGLLLLALLLLSGCVSGSARSDRRDGCRLLPSATAITDARMRSMQLSQDNYGCSIVGAADDFAVASMQQDALLELIAPACRNSTAPGEIIDAVGGDRGGFQFTLKVGAPPNGSTCDSASSSLIGDGPSDVVSRNMNSPHYPAKAFRARQQGTVAMILLVARDGRTVASIVGTSSGHQLLDDAAVRATANWTFYPRNNPSASEIAVVRVPVTFDLGDL